MPFPLAHPAAVLPLRRFCPRRLVFSALVIGCLVPDLGYCFGRFHVAEFSHRFIVGAFGFDLPVGFLIWLVFYGVRRPAIGLLPGPYRNALWPLCRRQVGLPPNGSTESRPTDWPLCLRPSGFPWMIAVSLLIGTWTHLLLDSMTHADGWIVEHLPILQHVVPWVGHGRLRINDALYDGCTFIGAGWLALAYLRWLETALGRSGPVARMVKRGCALVFALATLVMAEASRGWHPALGLFAAGIITVLLVLAYAAATGIGSRKSPADSVSKK